MDWEAWASPSGILIAWDTAKFMLTITAAPAPSGPHCERALPGLRSRGLPDPLSRRCLTDTCRIRHLVPWPGPGG